ncbi:MAG TPA: VOC family protein [Pseudonocardia sp.]|nr:VOC family protein [Pseudonocardia sp.]
MGDPVIHFEIGAADVERARRFYSALFGWEIETDETGYGMVRTGAASGIDGGLMQAPEGRPPWVTFYVGWTTWTRPSRASGRWAAAG